MPSLDARLEQLEQTEQQQEQLEITGQQICDYLASLPFWCGNDELHLIDPDYQSKAKCCVTHIVGLPRHPATNLEMPLTPFQVDFAMKIISGREKFGDATEQMRRALLIHLNKGRQMGFTEIVLRVILYLCFSRYAGANVGIIAATNGSLARKDLRRLARLFKAIPAVVEQWIKNNTIRLVNGTVIEGFPASEEAMTGDTKYKCIFMDESAKWRLQDDTPVFNSILPIARTNGADFLLISTPKGPVKMFYDIHEDPQDFELHEYDIWHTQDNLYTKKEIESMIASSKEDPEQEYLCKFKHGRDSIFGTVQTEDQQGPLEWIVESEESEEIDSYKESEQDKNDKSLYWEEDK